MKDRIINKMYEKRGISPEVVNYGERILKGLEERFREVDAVA